MACDMKIVDSETGRRPPPGVVRPVSLLYFGAMKTRSLRALTVTLVLIRFLLPLIPAEALETDATLHSIPVRTIAGEEITLGEYRGTVLLIVNTASRCGYTGQYAGLQELQEQYGDRGFTVLAFPSNSFRQELRTDEDVAEFCQVNFGTTFPLFSQVAVRGSDMHPVFTFLTSSETSRFPGRITWNFNKFLVGPDGTVINRFDTRTDPLDEEVIRAIENALRGT
jgi:glutathione peroxidase